MSLPAGSGCARPSRLDGLPSQWDAINVAKGYARNVYFKLTSLWCGVYQPIACYSYPGSNKQDVYHVGETEDVPLGAFIKSQAQYH